MYDLNGDRGNYRIVVNVAEVSPSVTGRQQEVPIIMVLAFLHSP